MKPFLQVDANRTAYHRDPMRNSVHRSSLLIPSMPDSDVEISFLNHFLLKRNYTNVGCRVTATNDQGRRIESRLHPVTEPKVYTLPLGRIFGSEARSYLVEFFAAENLFIPFPAVMVNHRGKRFANTVHAFNRVLNDVFEDDEINTEFSPPEAAIDVDSAAGIEGFFLLASGMTSLKARMDMEFVSRDGCRAATLDVDEARFSSRLIEFREVFPDLPAHPADGVLKISQPRQPMFYSRLFTGRRAANGAFSANHSYYDNSAAPEYWENDAPGFRSYPYFAGLGSRIRMYPIMSPGKLLIEIGLHDRRGQECMRRSVGSIVSPGPEFLDANIDELIADAGKNPRDISCFTVHARPSDGKTPTRINHQLLYGERLFSSINVSLKSRNNFAPEGKPGLTWGQILAGGESEGYLGIVGDDPAGPAADVEIAIYDETGEIGKTVRQMPSGGAVDVDLAAVIGRELEPHEQGTGSCYWFVARSSRQDLTAISLSRHAAAGQITGEHGF